MFNVPDSENITASLDMQARKYLYYEYIVNAKGYEHLKKSKKILYKNSLELYRFIINSHYYFKNKPSEIPTLKYTSVSPFCFMYQTAIECIIISYNSVSKKYLIKRIYRKGQHSQDECEMKVAQAIIRYHITDSRTPLRIAKYMKLK